jgi:activator of HSP90 ATPase
LEAKFKAFPQALIDTHAKDLTVIAGEDGTPSGSGAVTPARQPVSTASKATAISSTSKLASSAAAVPKSATPKPSTETQKVSSHFQASAQDLWDMLTDERRMPLWSQAPAQVSAFDILLFLTRMLMSGFAW